MAVSAFRSTSKRSNSGVGSCGKDRRKEEPEKVCRTRRSRSVSAVSRRVPVEESSRLRPTTRDGAEFSNTRHNPLFFKYDAPPTESEKRIGSPDGRRGRTASRGLDCSNSGGERSADRKGIRRSLSRVGTGRRQRSVSRVPARNYKSDHEQEQNYILISTLKNLKLGSSDHSYQNNLDLSEGEEASDLRKLYSRDQVSKCQDGSLISPCLYEASHNQEDILSSSYFSEAEEKTIKSVCEQLKRTDHPSGEVGGRGMYGIVRTEVRRAISEIQDDLQNAIERKNSDIANVSLLPELVDLDSIELISDIRREYEIKLEQSQERAKKLRADLHVEEQRGQQLCKILEEMVSNQKIPEAQRSQLRRKTSIERRKMSKRLTEEALNYFDECVSISTFDSVDFSSLVDPSSSLLVAPDSNDTVSLHGNIQHLDDKESVSPYSFRFSGTDFTANSSFSSMKETILMEDDALQDNPVESDTSATKPEFSFSSEVNGIRHYIKKFEKGTRIDGTEHVNGRSGYNACEYAMKTPAETLLYEKVVLKNRIDSGGLVLCNARSLRFAYT